MLITIFDTFVAAESLKCLKSEATVDRVNRHCTEKFDHWDLALKDDAIMQFPAKFLHRTFRFERGFCLRKYLIQNIPELYDERINTDRIQDRSEIILGLLWETQHQKTKNF